MQKKSTRTKNQIDNGVLFIFSIKSVRLQVTDLRLFYSFFPYLFKLLDKTGDISRMKGLETLTSHLLYICNFFANRLFVIVCQTTLIFDMLQLVFFMKKKSSVSFDQFYNLCISLLILSEIKLINQLLFPLKLSENDRFPDDFKGNRS